MERSLRRRNCFLSWKEPITAAVILKMYRDLPRIEFTYRVAKTLNEDVESLYLPLSLNLPDAEIYVHNGGVSMRPGIDQLPGTNMEYYMADEGLIYQTRDQAFLVNTLDTALLYMGEMESHPILLCDRQEKNNHRPVYSWIMNNTWETNFKMDLSGYCEFRYSIELIDNEMRRKTWGVWKIITLEWLHLLPAVEAVRYSNSIE